MPSLIHDLAASTPEMLAVFGDEALLRGALAFERELARAGAITGFLTEDEATAIANACKKPPEVETLARAAAHAGTLAIPLVVELRNRLASVPSAAAKVHFGATSQDVADTALMLQANAGLELICRDADILLTTLAALAERYADQPMLGRTLLQPARPITFGLKVAGWLLSLDTSLRRLLSEANDALLLQLGGAAGTLDQFGEEAPRVIAQMATALGLSPPIAPWHARRENIAGLGGALAILTGALGKMALDIALLSQSEIAEMFEPQIPGRGGSSAMAHKRNPTACQIARSAALHAPHLAAALFSALPQEHERGLGGWQIEGAVLSDLFCVTHGALSAMRNAAEAGFEIRVDRMESNLAAANVGQDIGVSPHLVAQALALWRGRAV
jgi:3-carboxy-cis,cis-muconate cycloisomerase